MSIKKLYSNELLASFEYSNIDKDYDFYYVTTSDKYIKGGATFLDIDDIKISALQFESGKSFWVMLPKNAISRAEFVRLLNAKEDGDSLSIKSMTSSSIPEYLLTQLFLNALTSPVDEMISFNNLSGKLLCSRPAWLNKDKENFIWGMQCLEVKIGDDMCVKLVAHRLTSLALKKQMKFEKRKLQDFPQYEFSYNNNTLKRVSNENKDRRENFIIKPVDGERGSITFFDFTDYETFSCTKMGVLYDILNALHDEFGKYIRVKFKQYSIDEVLEYKRASLELYKDIVKKEVLNSGINIVDAVHTETSEDYLQDVADGINKIIPEAKCSVGKRLSKKKLNVRYIHDKSFYSDSEVDPHKIKVHAELDIVIPHIDVNAEYTKANVMGLFKGITTKKEVVRYVFENTGIMLYAYLRGEEERREYLSGNIDINYFDYDDTHAKYSVGEIGNGMKYTIERASVVREIQAVEGSKLIFKKVLPLMGVEFVRYGMLTVVPFPFKYLREYIVKEEKSV